MAIVGRWIASLLYQVSLVEIHSFHRHFLHKRKRIERGRKWLIKKYISIIVPRGRMVYTYDLKSFGLNTVGIQGIRTQLVALKCPK